MGLSLLPSNHFRVGKPWTPNLRPSSLWSSASTLAMVTLSLANSNFVASSSQTGTSALQWPHQGAKNSTRVGLPDFKTSWSKLDGSKSMTDEAALIPRTSNEQRRIKLSRGMIWVKVPIWRRKISISKSTTMIVKMTLITNKKRCHLCTPIILRIIILHIERPEQDWSDFNLT